MAKSLRSKVKIRHRQEKRKKTAVKELARLEKTVEKGKIDLNNGLISTDLCTPVERSNLAVEKPEAMEVDASRKAVYNKNLKDENGRYPPWMNKKRKKSMARANKKQQRKAARKEKKKQNRK